MYIAIAVSMKSRTKSRICWVKIIALWANYCLLCFCYLFIY